MKNNSSKIHSFARTVYIVLTVIFVAVAFGLTSSDKLNLAVNVVCVVIMFAVAAIDYNYCLKRTNKIADAQNERHIKARQKNRVKSMEDWLDSPRYAPTESILRIGNVDDGFVCVEDLKKMTDCYIESLNDWSMNHGDCLHILNYAIHADEYYVDEDTNEEKRNNLLFYA